MKSTRLFALLCLVCFACGTVVSAADGWKLPNLNPFQKTSATRTHASVSDHGKWSLPKLSMPKWPTTKSSHSQRPSTLDKLNRETKILWTKTKGVLMPWSKTSTGSSNSRSQSHSAKPSFLSSMFGKKPAEPKRPRTVSDWLAQERVH